KLLIETLIPDFQGDLEAVRTVVDAGVDVLDHNVETVERLQGTVRDRRANYAQSLKVLRDAKGMRDDLFTKSSIMLALGETRAAGARSGGVKGRPRGAVCGAPGSTAPTRPGARRRWPPRLGRRRPATASWSARWTSGSSPSVARAASAATGRASARKRARSAAP